MVVASMYPASRMVVKPINCEQTYIFCVVLEHQYVYTSTIIANIEVCFIQMQCVIEALICILTDFKNATLG